MSMTKETIIVEGMSCGHCQNAVQNAVGAMEGVSKAVVDLAAKTLYVEFDASLATLAAIKETVEEEGYTIA